MTHHQADTGAAIEVREGDGGILYRIDRAPGALPPVTRRDLDAAWHAARQAATDGVWGVPRGFRFRRADGTPIDLALADRDAACWAEAVDARTGLRTAYGLSLCLRLLALVEVLAAPWARAHCGLARDGAELDPTLLAAAASIPLTDEARFDETLLRSRLRPALEAA